MCGKMVTVGASREMFPWCIVMFCYGRISTDVCHIIEIALLDLRWWHNCPVTVPVTHLPKYMSLHWRHNGCDGVSNHQPHDCLLNRLFRRRSMKTPKLRITCLCVGNSPVIGEFAAQMARYGEKLSIWWRAKWCEDKRSVSWQNTTCKC